jgi:ring-1,2-phenylacetyl-CoA epoxidase subunit PaaD
VVTGAVDVAAVRAAVAAVPDPEIPVVTIDDLGILRDVTVTADGRVEVTLTPTYSGCPAVEAIQGDVQRVLAEQGFADAAVRTVLAPAWTTDWISEEGRRKLAAYGIAPPGRCRTRPLPPVRVGRHPAAEPLRLHGLQGAAGVQSLPGTLRPLQTALARAPMDSTAPRHAVFHQLTVADVERITEDAVTITFAVPDELRDEYAYQPGQHLTVRCELAGDDIRRNYSPVRRGVLHLRLRADAAG